MKIKKYISVILSAALMFVCMAYCVSAETVIPEADYVEGEIIISSKKEIEDSEGMFVTSADEGTLSIDFEDKGIENIELISDSEETDNNVYVAEIDGDVEKICKELNRYSGITAEPNYIFETADFVMPAEVSKPSAYYRRYQKNYFEEILHIPEAWAEHGVTGEGVTVAVLDNGFDITTSDFPQNLWTDSFGHTGYNASNPASGDIGLVTDLDGNYLTDTEHGSNVAGIIGMASNGVNCIGAAYGAELMLIKTGCYIQGRTSSSIQASALYDGIVFAAEHGADIITMSVTSPQNVEVISQAVNFAYEHGVAVFAAAGNYGRSDAIYPAAYDNVIGVMAIDTADTENLVLTSFSEYDTGSGYYQIAAPGYAIVGCGSGDQALTLMSGTSQATPLAAACAALYLSLKPETTVDELYDAVINSSAMCVSSNSESCKTAVYTYRSINAQNLLNYTPVEEVPEPEIVFNYETTVTVNNGLLYGLDENFTDISHYISVADGTGRMEFKPTENGNGTGSTLTIYDNLGVVYKTYTIIIFGDLNGDCSIDGMDAVLVQCYLHRKINLSPPQAYAADVDFDGIVSAADTEFDQEIDGEIIHWYFPSDFTIINEHGVRNIDLIQIR